MSVSLMLDVEQLKTLVTQCSFEEKVELARFLEEETFEGRFSQLLKRLRTDELSLEDITQEVETVRRQRYERTNSSSH